MTLAPNALLSDYRYQTVWETDDDGGLVGLTFDLHDVSVSADLLRNIDLAQMRGWITPEQCVQHYREVTDHA